ncbi:hypothetical protein ACJX0J_041355, partial [Zea mays]
MNLYKRIVGKHGLMVSQGFTSHLTTTNFHEMYLLREYLDSERTFRIDGRRNNFALHT